MNNNALIPLLISFIAGISTVVGGLLVFIKVKDTDKFLAFTLSFSLSVMLSISVFELIPESFINIRNNYGLLLSLTICIISFIIGKLLVSFINKIVPLPSNNLYRVGVLSMLALMIHNFPEGIATFMSSYSNLDLGINLGIAIMLHNIPEGISIALPIYYATNSRGRGLLYSLISGLGEPLGAILAYLFLRRFITDTFISIILMIVAGIMITIAIDEMLPESNKYNKKLESIIGLILGLIIVLINLYLF